MFKKLSVVGSAAANGLSSFICDGDSDVANLPTLTNPSTDPICPPCKAGSTAISISSRKAYMLNNANQWVYYKNLDGGGGVAVMVDEGEVDIATVDEVANYIG